MEDTPWCTEIAQVERFAAIVLHYLFSFIEQCIIQGDFLFFLFYFASQHLTGVSLKAVHYLCLYGRENRAIKLKIEN